MNNYIVDDVGTDIRDTTEYHGIRSGSRELLFYLQKIKKKLNSNFNL
jgi:hypothetical protein